MVHTYKTDVLRCEMSVFLFATSLKYLSCPHSLFYYLEISDSNLAMFSIHINTDLSLKAFYQDANSQLQALLAGERDLICNASQFAAFIMQVLPDLNWAGFYFSRGNELVLGPYVGKVACTRIPFGRGVCGTAASTRVTQRIEDVHAFEGHIACDSASASEIVIPLIVRGNIIGVFDIDSPKVKRFEEVDQVGIENLVDSFIQATDFEWTF